MFEFADKIKNAWRDFRYRLKGIRVYALVGKSGTGKSFRAKLIAQKVGAELLIDDGLLIQDQRLLGGKSAKKEKNTYSAVKRALFFDPEQVRDAQTIIQSQDIKKILILATSIRMALKISNNLGLPAPHRIIPIEDVATEVEIAQARRARDWKGEHVIPVPAIEVKREHPHIFKNAVHILLKKNFLFGKKRNHFEKSIVQPEYSGKGMVKISEDALSQMVMHCVREFNPAIKLQKIRIERREGAYAIEVILEIPFEMRIAGRFHGLQHYILENIEDYTGLNLRAVDVTIGKIGKPKKKKSAGDEDQRELKLEETESE